MDYYLITKEFSAELWSSVLRNITFQGASGYVSFDELGDRIGDHGIFNYIPETNSWKQVGTWTRANGLDIVEDVIWNSNSTEIPDLDVREPYYYWSCHDKKMKYDETGKSTTRQTPDGSNVDDIDSSYHCDYFIDCKNLSDESSDCATNYMIVYIIFGIITGCLILLSILLIFFVILFGIKLQYRRLKKASPLFLILILISMIIGYSSIFTWYGKPHPVSCGFQPWLLGVSVNSMIVALFVKNIRIWRIFHQPMKITRIANYQLFALWFILLIPGFVILILWSVIATPTAKMKDINGDDHYVCDTGGFVGEPGGYVFFSIFVFYCFIILFLGAIVSFLIRNVPNSFNEAKILTISIYNLAFLGVVIIPVFLVVHPYNPFIAWILRTCAILYAFTAPMVIMFLPIIVGIFIIDKGHNITVFKSNLDAPTTPTTNSSGGDSDLKDTRTESH